MNWEEITEKEYILTLNATYSNKPALRKEVKKGEVRHYKLEYPAEEVKP